MEQDLKVVELELGFECRAPSREGGLGRAFVKEQQEYKYRERKVFLKIEF